jgi:hypothetical protein
MKEDFLSLLAKIVGEDYVSNRPEELYIISRDPGAQPPRKVDYIAMPKTTEEVQKIVMLANRSNASGSQIRSLGLSLSLTPGSYYQFPAYRELSRQAEGNWKSIRSVQACPAIPRPPPTFYLILGNWLTHHIVSAGVLF